MAALDLRVYDDWNPTKSTEIVQQLIIILEPVLLEAFDFLTD
jgi:hypothetical protein